MEIIVRIDYTCKYVSKFSPFTFYKIKLTLILHDLDRLGLIMHVNINSHLPQLKF